MSDIRKEGETLKGQEYDPGPGEFVTKFTQKQKRQANADTLVDAGTARTEITPVDAQGSLVRVYSPPTTAIEAYIDSFHGRANIPLPPILLGFTIIWETSTGEGEHSETGYGTTISTALSLSLSARAQGSAAIIPDVQPIWGREPWGQNYPVTHYLFFLATATEANILTRLNTATGSTVTNLPSFNPVSITLTATGRRMSASAEANIQQTASDNTFIKGTGSGTSREVGMIVKTIRIPPSLHAAISLGTTTQSATYSAVAQVSWPAGTNWLALGQSQPISGAIQATVTPGSIPATTPSALPTSGLYLVDCNVEPWRYGYKKVLATVFNFANLV
jgi:hypothetical protein